MATLLLRLAGPMQSWGTTSRFTERDSGREPSKSGVIGLICCALGVPQDQVNGQLLTKLTTCRMGVRVNREGVLGCDYQTASKIYTGRGTIKETEPSNRYFLSDADFLVGLESDDRKFLEEIDAAIRHPRWMLFLGRKAFPPAMRIAVGVFDLDMEAALKSVPFVPFIEPGFKPPNQTPELRAVLETTFDDPASDATPNDVPLCYENGPSRAYTIRCTRTTFWTVGNDIVLESKEAPCTSHD